MHIPSFFSPVVLLVGCALPLTLPAQVGQAPDRSQARGDHYILVLQRDAGMPEAVAAEVASRTNGRVGYIYEHVLQGFSISLPPAALAGVARDPRIASIEPDLPVSISTQTVPTSVDRIFADDVSLDIDSTDDYRVDADVAVLDTGIDLEHPDLNVVGGTNCLQSTGGSPWTREYYCDDAYSYDDDHYHGTHVAGSVGALDNGYGVVGVAPGTRLWGVKVLDSQGSGSLSGIIAGIDWVVANGNIEVINMSLGGQGSSSAMDAAVANAVASGVTVVVAAGNEDADAANYTPANAPAAITVSALADFDGLEGALGSPTCRTDEDDTLANFSNWDNGDAGYEVVNIAAPGVCILSTFPIEQGEYGTISGTSMASPHVAGAAALLASNGDDPTTIRSTLQASGNSNWTDDSGDGVQEPLLDIGTFAPTLVSSGEPESDSNSSPTAGFNASCTGMDCAFSDSSSDSDGSILSWAWEFGDGGTSDTANPSHSYGADGTYSVTLTVTDDDGATDSVIQNVTVSDGSCSGLSLTATGYKDKGLQKADLSWDCATSTNVDINRDGVVVTTTANDGSYLDEINQRGGGSYTYKICEESTDTCSNETTVTF